MGLETRLAKAQYDKVTNRDPFKTYNKKSLDEAETLAKLLSTAKKKGVMMADEQAVYDNLESTVEELKAALGVRVILSANE